MYRYLLILSVVVALGLLIWLTLLRYRVPQGDSPEKSREEGTYILPSPEANPTGHIRGRVLWQGEIPKQDSITGFVYTDEGSRWQSVPNPFTPKIDEQTKSVAGAVVWLSGIDPKQSKPWPRGPLQVEMKNKQLRLNQDGASGVLGFVKLGEEIEIVTRDNLLHSVRARGAAFFSYPFPQPNKPINRKMTSLGRVDLTSGAGFFWCGNDLFVCEHPYYTVTNAEGQFEFAQVPAGDYEIIAWLRPWQVQGRDRDPENGRIVRLHLAPPTQSKSKVQVQATGTTETELKLP